MSEVSLVPYSDLDPLRLGIQLYQQVRANTELLQTRNLLGVIERYGGNFDVAREHVQQGQSDADSEHLAVMREGQAIGAASIYPSLPLHKLRAPMPPVLARGPLRQAFPHAGPEIRAWTIEGAEDALTDVYEQLLVRVATRRPIEENLDMVTWTLEPRRSPAAIHQAITLAGLKRVATRRFDDAESRRHTPPRGTVYADLTGDYRTARGRQGELRSGPTGNVWPFVTDKYA